MRTTVSIDDTLLTQAKEFAAHHRRTLNSVLEDALRELLVRHAQRTDGPRIDLFVFTGDGLMPGIDVDLHGTLHDLDEEQDADRVSGRRQ